MTDADLSRATAAPLARVLQQHHDELLAGWLSAQVGRGRSGAADLQRQGSEFLGLLGTALGSGATSMDGPAFAPVRGLLDSLSRERAQQGF